MHKITDKTNELFLTKCQTVIWTVTETKNSNSTGHSVGCGSKKVLDCVQSFHSNYFMKAKEINRTDK